MADALHIPTLAACFGEAPDPVWVIDREGAVRFANAAAHRALAACGAGEGSGGGARGGAREGGSVTPGEGALGAALERACRAVIERGVDVCIELAGPRGPSDDAVVLGALRASPVRAAGGGVVAVMITGVRVRGGSGERDAALSAERERLRRTIQQAPALVAIMRGPDHVYETVNERFCELIPDAQRLVGTSARAHRADLVAEQFVELLDQVWQTREPYESIEVPRVVERDGGSETIFLTFVYQPILSTGGAVEGIAIIAFDVTESVLARKLVEEASRAKDDFLSTLSHELRTPLNAIVGWSHLLRTGALQGAQSQRALEAIDRNAKAQKRLIDDLLDFSRMVSGKLGVQEGVVDLAELVEGAVESIRPAVAAKRVDLHARFDARPIVLGDGDRLQQVVSNLLSNAAKFTGPRGRIEVAVRLAGDCAEIEVRDDGLGIEPSFLPHVFERFRQADGSTTRRHGGLGLGLAISRAIVEMHGGRIGAESAGLGRGTRVLVSLPRAASPHPGALVSARDERTVSAPPRLSGVRVLVVDDEVDACVLAEAVLRSAGAEVSLASSAGEAIELLHASEIDVLVSDLGMPELDGITLIERVRAMPAPACHIPAVALTGYASAENRERAVDAGYDAFLSKPLDVEALAASVARVAGRIGPDAE